MILEELVLHDFGVYAARQTLNLTPAAANRPITLIGGLNGSGKTSLLDALLLALYGPLASLAARNELSYEAYLRRMIHRAAPLPEAAIELAFRTHRDGSEQRYRIRRVWKVAKSGTVAERIEVLHNDTLDRHLTETWPEQVESFVPRGVAPFFFFDAEQLETFADAERSREVLRTAIGSLLGLDLVQKLGTDLVVLERRKATSVGTSTTRSEIDTLQGRLDELRRTEERAVQDLAAAQVRADRCTRHLQECQERFRLEGGDLFQQRHGIDEERASLATKVGVVEEELRDLAAGPACFLLVATLLPELLESTERAHQHARLHELRELLVTRDSRLQAELRTRGVPDTLLDLLEEAMRRERESLPTDAPSDVPIGVDTLVLLRDLQRRVLPEVRASCAARLQDVSSCQEALDATEGKLASVPASDAIADLERRVHEAGGQLTAAREAYRSAEERLLEVRKDIQDRERKLSRVVENATRESLEGADDQRIIRYSQRVRQTLAQFEKRATEYHTRRIQQLILGALLQLLRKTSLISGVTISPDTFLLELQGSGGMPVSPGELSAGERQLVATGVLWGLAKAAGRPLPVVIDTPLGRLDSVHRRYLLERYFPHVSHQVILLSTDGEIDDAAHQKLRRYIGRSYRLDFQSHIEATRIVSGYFEAKA